MKVSEPKWVDFEYNLYGVNSFGSESSKNLKGYVKFRHGWTQYKTRGNTCNNTTNIIKSLRELLIQNK